MVSTIKFSEFAAANLNDSTNKSVGLSGGGNASTEIVVRWTTATRPSAPFNGILGYNTDLSQYEYWDSGTSIWFQLGTGDTGTVTLIDTGTGLTGGPITETGTISFASIAANSLWANVTGGIAVPTVISTGTFLITANDLSDVPNKATARINLGLEIGVNVEAWSATLDTIAGLGKVPLNLGGTNANLIANIGGIVYSTATAFAILAGTATAGQILRSGASTSPTWSTATYPATAGTSGNVLVSDGTNWSSGTVTGITALGVQAQALDMGSHLINNVLTPVSNLDAANKQYVDTTALNGTSVYAASAASLGTVTQSGAGVGATLTNAGVQAVFTLDGATPPVGSNVLIKNTATGMTSANEGIYTVTDAGSIITNWVLTRATDYDTPTEINNTGLILVQNGSTLVGTAWYNAATIVTVDTTAFSYSQFGNVIFPITLAQGGTSASLTASNGGIFYSTATAGAILAGTATARQMLQSGATAAPAWSTTTWPATSTINRILFSSANNVIGEISTVNSAGLLTDGSGVPGWVAYTGTGAPVLGTGPTISAPLINQINDQSNNLKVMEFASAASAVNYIIAVSQVTGVPPGFQFTGSDSNVSGDFTAKGTGGFNFYNNLNVSAQHILSLTGVASAVNYITIANRATGAGPQLTATGSDTDINLSLIAKGAGLVALQSNGQTAFYAQNTSASAVNSISAIGSVTGSPLLINATGTDTNISMTISSKGTGRVAIQGISTNTAQTAGYVGELLSATNLAGSPITFTGSTDKTLQTVTLTPGDWDVFGNIFFSATTVTGGKCGISTTNNTQPDNSLISNVFPVTSSPTLGLVAPTRTFSVSSNTPVYLVGTVSGTGTLNGSGGIYARRRS